MSDSNWIKLNRGIWDNFIWDFQEPKYALAWIDMLLMANYKDKKILFNGKVETVKRGSFITSMVKLSERWDMNRKTVKTLLDTLQSEEMIRYECTNRRTTIFILKYEVFQGFCVEEGQLNGQQNGQQKDNRTDSKRTAERTQHKKVKKIKRSLIENNHTYVDEPLLNDAILAFVEHRKSLKKPMTDNAVKLMLNKLNKLSSDVGEQIEIINQSIVNGWQGIFPLNQQNGKSTRKEVVPKWLNKPGFNDFPQSTSDEQIDNMEKRLRQEVNGKSERVEDNPDLAAEAEELKKMLKEKY